MEQLNINEIRDDINETDKEIVKLLERRFNIVLKVGEYKKINNLPIFDEERESQVIEKCVELLSDQKYSHYLKNIYVEIMNTCKEIQKNEIWEILLWKKI